jgi:hypothetical protein
VTRASLREYAAVQRERYQHATRAEKHQLLDELVTVTGMHRKAAIRLLRRAVASSAWVLAALGQASEALSRLREGEQLVERQTASGVVGTRPRRPARSRTSVSALSSAVGRWKSESSSSIRPASIFERSRMSLISERRCCPEA